MESYRPKQLKFEDYNSFFHDSTADNLTVSQLNQILFIHGFVKLNQHTKEYVIDAASSVELMPPTRSTICGPTGTTQSSFCHIPPLQLMELKQDIREIEWQECPIGSAVTVNPLALQTSDDSISDPSCLTVLPEENGRGAGMVRWRIKRDKEKDKLSLVPSLHLPKPPMDGKNDTTAKVKPEMEKTTHVVALSLKNADGYSWKSTGSKVLMRPPNHRRLYYRCRMPGCGVKKYIDGDLTDPVMCKVTYKGVHNHASSELD